MIRLIKSRSRLLHDWKLGSGFAVDSTAVNFPASDLAFETHIFRVNWVKGLTRRQSSYINNANFSFGERSVQADAGRRRTAIERRSATMMTSEQLSEPEEFMVRLWDPGKH